MAIDFPEGFPFTRPAPSTTPVDAPTAVEQALTDADQAPTDVEQGPAALEQRPSSLLDARARQMAAPSQLQASPAAEDATFPAIHTFTPSHLHASPVSNDVPSRSMPQNAPPPTIERRRAARQTLVARATIRPDNPLGPGGPSAVGYVSNISLLGIAFHTRKPLSANERYQIKLEVGPMKWTSRLRIVSCQPHASGTWDVGAAFVANELSPRRQRDLAA